MSDRNSIKERKREEEKKREREKERRERERQTERERREEEGYFGYLKQMAGELRKKVCMISIAAKEILNDNE